MFSHYYLLPQMPSICCYSHSFRSHMGTLSFSPSTYLGSTIMKNPSSCKSLLVQYVQSPPLRPDKRTAGSQHVTPRPQRAHLLADYSMLASRVRPVHTARQNISLFLLVAFRRLASRHSTRANKLLFSPLTTKIFFVRARCLSTSIPTRTAAHGL